MKILRFSLGHTRLDRIRNDIIRKRAGVAPIDWKARERRLQWFGHVYRAPDDAIAKLGMKIETPGTRPKGRPRLRWTDTLRCDIDAVGI